MTISDDGLKTSLNDLNAAVVHLHTHSWFSLLAGTTPVEALAQQAVAQNMTHLALTDSNALYGAVRFHKACNSEGIHPILGMTMLVSAPSDLNQDVHAGPGYLVLLATGPKGYQSLYRLSSHLQGHPHRDAIIDGGLDWETLRNNRDGLICLSGGRRGWLDHLVRPGMQKRRPGMCRTWQVSTMIMPTCRWSFTEAVMRTLSDIANEIVDLGLRFGVRTVTVHSVYCLLSEERDRLDLPAAIDHNCRLKDVPVTRLAAGGDAGITLHWLDPEQMAGRYAAFPDALAETSRIARLCDPALPDSCLLWPVLDLGNDQTADEALADDAMKGLRVRYGDQEDKGSTVQTRLRRELHAIAQHGFAPLFLLVADSVRFARSQSIPVSTRGSVANSLVACCTSITTVDPIEHDLLFERFLNPAREDPPDIDLDFCSRHRDEVLDYVGRTYCEEKVALVATISTMRPKPLPEKRAKRWS